MKKRPSTRRLKARAILGRAIDLYDIVCHGLDKWGNWEIQAYSYRGVLKSIDEVAK